VPGVPLSQKVTEKNASCRSKLYVQFCFYLFFKHGCVSWSWCTRHCVIDSISFSDSGVVMATSKNNIKNAAQPTTAILMTSPRDDKDDVIDAKLDSFVDDMDGRYILQHISLSYSFSPHMNNMQQSPGCWCDYYYFLAHQHKAAGMKIKQSETMTITAYHSDE